MASDTPRVTTVLELADMPAIHALRAVEFALGAVPGVEQVTVSRETAVIEHVATVDAAALRAAVEVAGARVVRTTRERRLPML
jgi:copper chaperone CopZ